MGTEPRYQVGDRVIFRPQGLIFGGRSYHATITEVCGRCEDPRIGASPYARTYYYRADIEFPTEVTEGIIYKYEIVGKESA